MTDETPVKKQGSGWLNVAVDYGPLVVFLAVYKIYSPEESEPIAEIAAVIRGTLAFMVAAVIALTFSKFKFGKVSPMLLFSTVLIVGFGALTVLFGDPTFVQLKPTIIYTAFAVALLIGYWRGKGLLKMLLGAAFEGLTDEGWLKLSRNWAFFFAGLAIMNEGLRFTYNVDNNSFETWLWAKFWVFMPLTLLFTVTQIPMLLRHGLDIGEEEKPATDDPPTGE